MVNALGLAVGFVGLLAALWFGFRSMLQSQDLESFKTAVSALNQGIFNNIWRMGANAENALKESDISRAMQFVRGIADVSQTTRQVLIAFSAQHLRLILKQEEGWKPNPLEPERPKSFWRILFRL